MLLKLKIYKNYFSVASIFKPKKDYFVENFTFAKIFL